jgi:hypothetical protein
MLLERLGETVTLEPAEGDPVEVPHVLCLEADVSDQSVMDVQTRFINQARYKGDNVTLTVWWPKRAPHDLMDSHLVIRGERYRVYGAPFNVARSPNGYDARLTAIRPLFRYSAELLATTVTLDEWGVPSYRYEGPTVPVNLLRLSESLEATAGRADLARVALIELPPGTWDESYTHFRLDGHLHRVESVERAGDVVVLSGTREATDG